MDPSEYTPLPKEAHEYVSGLLASDDEERFSKRMTSDAELRRRVGELQAARRILSGFAYEDPPEDFDRRILQRVRQSDWTAGARKRLVSTHPPLWQHGVVAATGAVAAAVTFVVVGWFGGTGASEDEILPAAAGGGEVARLDVTEDDLLPMLGEHYDRYDEFSRHVLGHEVSDPGARREMIRYELEFSGLGPRSSRLLPLVDGLPADRRREHRKFLESLKGAVAEVEAELSESLNEGRQVDSGMLQKALGSVYVPSVLEAEGRLRMERIGRDVVPAGKTCVSAGGDPEVAAYARAREAFYSRDYKTSATRFEEYLHRYPRGRFLQGARACAVAALLRADRVDDAVKIAGEGNRGAAEILRLLDAQDRVRFEAAWQQANIEPPRSLTDD